MRIRLGVRILRNRELATLILKLEMWGGFARTGRLWPLIVAHALQDFTALVVDSSG
jgi:hypothetical protein